MNGRRIKKFRDVEFLAHGITLAGQEWGRPGDFPVLALHGWLDNSASFDVLAPHLEDIHLIALDMAGHGRSGHRARGAPYPIWQDIGEVFAVADQLGWQQFALLGHSRGAIVSTLAAGTFPERITHLALIDGFRPGATLAAEAPQQLARSIIETQRVSQKSLGIYPDMEAAILVRSRSEIPVSYEAAKLLASRGLVEREGGYAWSSDPHLKIASAFRLTEEHSDAFVNRIAAPITLVLAEDGLPRIKEHHERVLARFPRLEVVRHRGGHHLHMGDAAVDIAAHFNDFFRRRFFQR